MRMNIQQLKTLVAVVDAGSFSKAARALGVSQPAVTMQVQNLEIDLGHSLLDRRYRRIELTEPGQMFLPYARDIIQGAERARIEMNALSGEITGFLHLALSTIPGDYIIPRLLGGFLELYPRIHIQISVGSTSEAIVMVEERKADIGMVGAIQKNVAATYHECGHDELILIAPPAHPLSGKKNVKLADVLDEPWISRIEGSGTRKSVSEIFHSSATATTEPTPIVELGTGEAVVSAVEGGLGIAIVSRYVAKKPLALGTVSEIMIPELPYRRPFYLAVPKRTPTRAALAFYDYVIEQLA